MKVSEVFDGLSCFSLSTLSLALRRPSELRLYISHCLRKYDELVGNGLPCRAPVTPAQNLTITIPAYHAGGGMSFNELIILARATKILKPGTIFEVGSYSGLTTAVFELNSDPDARIVTLDLPPGAETSQTPIASDKELVASRHLALVPQALGLCRYTQLLCDSMDFDPLPYLDCVDLGLIDGAHDVAHVQNDTLKMARMMSDRGIVFWHDYGGKGKFKPLASYLESLAKRCPLYRIPGTSLAWAPAQELKSAILETRS
jgi:hypothetical protein